ncbi:bifunctional DNA primase/polymerase [Streptomyces sp. H27-G5]|uniref:bifunctional DNA primase/polymerase n=1 Tax=Streptomyces sp. H27-G5 TaxID=2996698 RepID=UPI003B63D2F3
MLATLADRLGKQWPETLTVTTPSGGQHLYFAAPDATPPSGRDPPPAAEPPSGPGSACAAPACAAAATSSTPVLPLTASNTSSSTTAPWRPSQPGPAACSPKKPAARREAIVRHAKQVSPGPPCAVRGCFLRSRVFGRWGPRREPGAILSDLSSGTGNGRRFRGSQELSLFSHLILGQKNAQRPDLRRCDYRCRLRLPSATAICFVSLTKQITRASTQNMA